MTAPRCSSPGIQERLSAFLEGELSAGDAQVVRAHVEACPACAQIAAELKAIVGAARTLDRPEPPPTLWRSIEGALDVLEAEAPAPPAWLRWRPFGAGMLAGAAAVAAIVVVMGARARRHEPAAVPPAPVLAAAVTTSPDPMLEEAEAEFASAAAAYERSIEKLRGLLAVEEPRWSADERARYAERLAGLDDAIARSRELARRTRGDSAGNEQLFAAYQQKIAFLAAAVHRGGSWGEGPR